ncbi:hypothetical protein AB0M97_01505 [Streptomyces sp. NPDC051207]|uniref:hypothetical protein n=1 Tax=Streptomyces sp. NPDC051207 TaxID=3154641 RepID=UPI0034418F5E
MRRTARALSVAVLTGVALGGPTAVVRADPAAEVSPATVQPGGSVTVSVSCDPGEGPAPQTLEATSDAFADGVAELRLVPGNDDDVTGSAYRGTARIASAAELDAGPTGGGPDSAWTVDGTCPAPPGAEGKQWSATFTVTLGGGASTAPPSSRPCPEHHAKPCGGAVIQRGVRAGGGGAFTDSVPALAAGGVFIAAAVGGAVYRLRRKRPAREA